MLELVPLLEALAAVGLAASAPGSGRPVARWEAGEAIPHLEVRPVEAGPSEKLAVAPVGRQSTVPPPCLGDVCQAKVDVPGFGPSYGKAHKTELVVALLDRARIEPFASVAWFFVVTGLRLDWTPANMDASLGATRGGWGNVFVRVRLRIDPWNLPTVPARAKLQGRLAPVSAPGA